MMKEFDKQNINYVKAVFLVLGIILVFSLVIFLIVFGVKSFSKKPINNEEYNIPYLDIDKEVVQKAYSYVNSCNSGSRVNKYNYFYTHPEVKTSTLTQLEKIRCAFQFVGEETLEVNNNRAVISEDVVNENIAKIFGSKEEFILEKINTKPITVLIDRTDTDLDYATLTYNQDSKNFNLDFRSEVEEERVINNYYTELVSAYEEDDKLVLKEKIIYVEDISTGDKYSYRIYNDISMKEKIYEARDVPKEKVKISIADFYDDASVITYTFKKDENDNYTFVKSEINEGD